MTKPKPKSIEATRARLKALDEKRAEVAKVLKELEEEEARREAERIAKMKAEIADKVMSAAGCSDVDYFWSTAADKVANALAQVVASQPGIFSPAPAPYQPDEATEPTEEEQL